MEEIIESIKRTQEQVFMDRFEAYISTMPRIMNVLISANGCSTNLQ